jgi:hypothetical protein
VQMTLRTRFWAVAALLAVLGTPGLSCFVPRQLLGADQNECCRQMGSQCGSKEMSNPQSCCKAPSQQNVQPYVRNVGHSQIVSAAQVAAFLPVGPTSIPFVADSEFSTAPLHSPPLNLLEANSVLRV